MSLIFPRSRSSLILLAYGCTLLLVLYTAVWKHLSQMKFLPGDVSVVVLVPAIWLLSRDGVGLQSCVILPGSSPSPASFPLTGAWAIGTWRTVMLCVMVMSRKEKTTWHLNLPKVENIPKQARGGTPCVFPTDTFAPVPLHSLTAAFRWLPLST